MRVTKVTFVDWLHDRQPHRTLQAVVPAAKADGKPNENEDAPPAPEPDKGVHFEGWA
ncbi:MAG TPA: hypothetical protein V6D05_11245 [Stenomitos sp.]